MNLIFCALWVYSNSSVRMNVFMLRTFWIRSARIRVKSRKKVPAARCNWTTNYNGPRLAVGCRGCTRQRVLPRPLRLEAISYGPPLFGSVDAFFLCGYRDQAKRTPMSIIRLIHIKIDPSEIEKATRIWKT